ncbi:hypothetical protein M8J75_009627 [Diaphorina citri]|nr:hypothetical protein M8J75_009627 [Diaphorina citri]
MMSCQSWPYKILRWPKAAKCFRTSPSLFVSGQFDQPPAIPLAPKKLVKKSNIFRIDSRSVNIQLNQPAPPVVPPPGVSPVSSESPGTQSVEASRQRVW